jgi:hypothetical protein
LQDVINNKKQIKDLSKKQQKFELNVGGSKKKEIAAQKATSESDSQKIMELLELEMRARAIKSLLSKTKDDQPLVPLAEPVPKKPKNDEEPKVQSDKSFYIHLQRTCPRSPD